MNWKLIGKIAAVGLVSLLLLIPVAQVESLTHERQALRDQVVADLAKGVGYAQVVHGPLVVVPYERTVRSWVEATKEQERHLVEEKVTGQLVFVPQSLDVEGNASIEERSRGIYKSRFFTFTGALRGEFYLEPNYGIKEDVADYRFAAPYLVLGVSDIRGIRPDSTLQWGASNVPFQPNPFPVGERGAGLEGALSAGMHALLPAPTLTATGATLPFAISLALQGTGQLQFVPVGRTSGIHLASNWAHPNFGGEFLPTKHAIGASGFDATWETSHFATNIEGLINNCRTPNPAACSELSAKTVGVSFVDPVDHYLQSERATKYAFLFVGLTFAVFFLFEVLRRFSVHPVQYGLVGLALAVFFLLLLSLSEHLGFALAYAMSAGASVALIGYYVIPILGSVPLAAGFSFALSGLYAVLYCILGSEDYALVTGALVVFTVLCLAMGLTRRVNWSKFGQAVSPEAALPKAASAESATPGAA